MVIPANNKLNYRFPVLWSDWIATLEQIRMALTLSRPRVGLEPGNWVEVATFRCFCRRSRTMRPRRRWPIKCRQSGIDRRRQTLKHLAAFSFVWTDDHAAGLWKYNCVVFAAAEARVQEKKNQLIWKKLLSCLFFSPSFFILVWIFGSTSVCQGFVLKAIVHSSSYLQATLVEHEMTYFSPVLST